MVRDSASRAVLSLFQMLCDSYIMQGCTPCPLMTTPVCPQVFPSGFTGLSKLTLTTSGQAAGSASVFAVDNMCLA